MSAAKIVESGISELRFTNEFCAYLAQYNQGNLRIKAATVEGWRDIMLDFDPNLKTLSDEEISMTIVLLDYFLQKASVK